MNTQVKILVVYGAIFVIKSDFQALKTHCLFDLKNIIHESCFYSTNW